MGKDSESVQARCILPIGTAAIRVLHLKPGNESDEIEATLGVVDLGTELPHQYTCVSYVWGDPKTTKSVIVNEQYIEVTTSLYDALRHIRSKTEPVVTWADAICIDQSDVDEKSRQVALMTKIYRQCSRVYIWLGAPDSGSLRGNPFDFLDHFVQGKHFYDLPGFCRDHSTGRLVWRLNEACENMLNDFLHIVRSPWWTRAWTAQEGLLPKDAVLMFGSRTTNWDYILESIHMKNNHGNGSKLCCKEAIQLFNPPQRFVIEDWMWYPGWAGRFREVLHEKRQPQPFYQTLLAFTSRKCLDPRDKVYSILSLATHSIYRDFKPDYRADVSTIYTDIFTRMVQETHSNFICFMGGGFGSSMPNLPSWVRDFSQVREAGTIAGEDKRINFVTLYQASLASPFPILWDEKNNLYYKGIYADTVSAVGHYLSPSNLGFTKVFRQWLGMCKDTLGSCEPTILRTTFCRIICGDVCKNLDEGPRFRRAKKTDFPEEDAFHRLINGDINALDMRSYGGGINFAVWGRCFFTTSFGRMGLCHPNTLPGDEIWIMSNVKVPFVIRPLGRADVGCATKYSLRGDCFLDKIMDGELGDKEKTMQRPIVLV